MFKEEFETPGRVETQPDVFSLQGLIAWLRTQSPERTYDFNNCNGACLLDQYLISRGIRHNPNSNNYSRMVAATIGRSIDVSCDRPWTYGASLQRALALQSTLPD